MNSLKKIMVNNNLFNKSILKRNINLGVHYNTQVLIKRNNKIYTDHIGVYCHKYINVFNGTEFKKIYIRKNIYYIDFYKLSFTNLFTKNTFNVIISDSYNLKIKDKGYKSIKDLNINDHLELQPEYKINNILLFKNNLLSYYIDNLSSNILYNGIIFNSGSILEDIKEPNYNIQPYNNILNFIKSEALLNRKLN